MKFIYVDESGQSGINDKGNSSKYFVVSGMMIDSDNLLKMERRMRKVKANYGIHPNDEYKWNAKYSKFGLDYNQHFELRKEMFMLIKEISDCVIATVMDKKQAYQKDYIDDHFELYQESLYLLMERFHMALSDNNESNGPVIFVIDSRKNNKDATLDDRLAQSYKRALRTGTYFFQQGFPSFSETAFFTTSEDSAGLQLADYCAGPILRYFENNKDDWYEYLRPSLRSRNGRISGYGIKQFPTSPKIVL